MKTYLKVLLSQILIWTAIHHTQAKSILTYPLTDKDDISIVSEEHSRNADSERLTPSDFIIKGNETKPSSTNDSSDTDFSTLSTFTTNGSSTTFSDPAAWDMGLPPNDGTADIVIAHDLDMDIDFTANDLTVNPGVTLTIKPGKVLKVTGTLTNNGLIYFESDGVNGSAQFDTFNGTINPAATGEVTVERFVPARFGNRYITTPITTSGSIRDNWQEGVNNIGGNFPADNINPNPGFGTHITGADTSKGFDQRENGFVGMKFHDPTANTSNTGGLVDLENTNVRTLRGGEPFFLQFRGDRSVNVDQNDEVPVTASRLRSTGDLFTGSQTYEVGSSSDFLNLSGSHRKYRLIGNPYQSVVDYSTVEKDDLTDYIYIWDIHLGGAEGRGSYVVIDTNPLSAPSPWSSEASQYIPPGMAFWVQNLPSGSTEITAPFSPSLIFDEDDKTTDAAEVGVLNAYPNFYINSRVYKTSDLLSGNTESDALGLRFNSDDYTTEPSTDEDAPFDLFNSKVHYKVVYNSSTLWSIEKRKVPNINDEIQLFIDYDLPLFSVTDPDTTEFSLTYEVGNKPELLPLFLKDDYENTETLITENLSYDFTIDTGIPDSTFYFRFSLVFNYPKDYYLWEAGFDDNFNNKRVFEDAAFANNIKTLTVEATADGDSNDNNYRIFERSENDKWQNASTAFNEVFTLSHGGAGSSDGVTAPAASDGNYYTVQIDGYDVIDRQAVFMETDNAPIEFATNNAITLPTTEIMAGQPVTLNINLAGNKSSQERAFVRYSTDGFTTSNFVEVTFSTPTSNTGDATIPGFVLGTLVEFYVYTTTIDVNNVAGIPNHDLYTLRQGKDFAENYIYNVGPEYMTKGGATDWNLISSWLRNQLPPDGSDVIIAHDLSLTDNQTVETIEFISDAVLNGTGELSIQDGGTVTNSNATEVSIEPTVVFEDIGADIGEVIGEVAFNAVEINGGVNFGDPGVGNQSTINGSLTLKSGSFVLINSPFYGDGSTLIYDTGGPYGRASEWSNASATQSRPHNVIVKNGTILQIGSPNNNKATAAIIDGELSIEAGAELEMNSAGHNMTARLEVGGNFLSEGEYRLSNLAGGDLAVYGNFTDNGTDREFNNRDIIFEGPNNQNLTAANDFEIPYVVIDKTAGQVILQQDIILNGSGTALNMNNEGVLNLNDHQLQIGDNTNTQVSFSGNAGLVGSLDSRILFKSTSNPAGDLVFKQDAAAYENYLSEFEMDGSGTVGISNTLNILRRFHLKGGDFDSNGHLTFKSSETTTAIIPPATPGSSITGEVRIERHFPESNRAFRYISSPVTTSTSINPSINANWQEGATTIEPNPNPGYGTHITGVIGTAGVVNANGLDETQTGNNSLFTFDETNQADPWVPVTSTNDPSDLISIGEPYALMVRGDRSTSLNSNVAVGPATTLRTSGEIKIGLHSPAIDNSVTLGDFILVGNPYQAPVDMNLVTKIGINPDYMWIFDPTLGNKGGYAAVDLLSGDVDYTSVPGTSQANKFLQPFQACFVQANSNSQAIFFLENYKFDTTDNIGTFSTATVQTNVLNIELEQQNTQILVDAVKLSFGPNFTTPASFEDATKLWNSTEHLAIVNDSDYLVIDKRNLPQVNDTVPLYLGNYQESQYTLKLESTLESDIPAILYDEYLDQTLVLNNGDNTYDFSIDNAIPASIDNLRFKLVFNPETLGTEDLVSTTLFSVYPNPTDDILYINSDKTFLGQEVELTCFDQTGRLVLSQSISKLEANTSLDLSRLSAGLYLLKLETDGHQETFKIQVR